VVRSARGTAATGRTLLRVTAAALLLAASLVQAEWLHDEQPIMGTRVTVTLWHDDRARGEQAIAAVLAEMRRIDAAWNPDNPAGELAALNAGAARQPVRVSAEMLQVLARARDFGELTGGAFDVTFASVGHYYDYRAGAAPSDAQRREALPAIDYRSVILDPVAGTVRYTHPGTRIDLGGIAKGHAIDCAVRVLREHGVAHASVSAGGDSYLLGDRRGRPWLVGIKNPRGEQAALVLPLSDTALSTSGDYERYFIDPASGERIHHILNPRTGRSAEGIASVSVLGPRGIDTDALSTSVFVLGVERGLALLNRLPGVDGVIIDRSGKVFYSEGLAPPE
jgi:thiamine biosynthesis lipoprotein